MPIGIGSVAAIKATRRAHTRRAPSTGRSSSTSAAPVKSSSSGVFDSLVGRATKAASAASSAARHGLEAAKGKLESAAISARMATSTGSSRRPVATPMHSSSGRQTPKRSADVYIDPDAIQLMVDLGIDQETAESALKSGMADEVLEAALENQLSNVQALAKADDLPVQPKSVQTHVSPSTAQVLPPSTPASRVAQEARPLPPPEPRAEVVVPASPSEPSREASARAAEQRALARAQNNGTMEDWRRSRPRQQNSVPQKTDEDTPPSDSFIHSPPSTPGASSSSCKWVGFESALTAARAGDDFSQDDEVALQRAIAVSLQESARPFSGAVAKNLRLSDAPDKHAPETFQTAVAVLPDAPRSFEPAEPTKGAASEEGGCLDHAPTIPITVADLQEAAPPDGAPTVMLDTGTIDVHEQLECRARPFLHLASVGTWYIQKRA